MMLSLLRETPSRADREKADVPYGVAGGGPAPGGPPARKEGTHAARGLRLVVEDLDASVLERGRDVVGHLVEWIAIHAVSHPVPDEETVAGVQDPEEHYGANKCKPEDESNPFHESRSHVRSRVHEAAL